MDPDNNEIAGAVPLGSLHLSELNHNDNDNEATRKTLRSNLARNQDQFIEPDTFHVQQAPRGSRAKRPRNENKRRKGVRAELYNHSLLALEDHTRSSVSSETMHQIFNIRREKSIQDLVSSASAWEEEKMLESLKPETQKPFGAVQTFSTWLIFELLMCRNMALSVYANCKTLQASNLAGDYFSVLALCATSAAECRLTKAPLYRPGP